jgi:phytoene synthase
MSDAVGAAPGAGDARALALVRDLTRRSGSNFYYAFLLMPRRRREAIFAVYALARAVDDAVDEVSDPSEARARLAEWSGEIDRLEAGRARHPIAQAVARARESFPIPVAAMRALLAGAAMDLERSRYASFDELRVYCERVASAIGLMCIEIFGYRSPRTVDYARDLGIALQLTNILRDLGQDAKRGRLYLPLDDLARHGALEADLLVGRRTPATLALLDYEAHRARSFYASARASLEPCDRRALVPAEVMRAIYERLLARMERSRFDVFDRRVRLSRAHRALIAAGVWARSRLGSGRGGA